jgi:hypothetical protein
MAIEPHFHLMPAATVGEIDAGERDDVAATPLSLAHKWEEISAPSAFRILDKVTAGSGGIGAQVSYVWTGAYDASVHPTKGAALYRQSDATETSVIDSRFWFVSANGRYFLIDTNQKITLTMAGARGNLTYELQSGLNNGGGNGNGTTSTEGFIRTAGTNDRTAMLALDAFAAANGIPAYIDADHYISSQTKLTAEWVGIDGQYRHTLWMEYFSPYDGTIDTVTDEIEIGFWFVDPGPLSGLKKLKIIGQWNHDPALPTKPSVCVPDMPILGPGGGLGDRGAIIEIGDQYYPSIPTAPITHCDIDVMIMRAGHKTSTQHYSRNNMMIAVSGYVEHCDIKVGLFGKTNTTNSWPLLMLWGGHFDETINGFAPYSAFIPNKTQATLIEQYFPSHCTVEFLTDIDNTTTFANIQKALELNGCGPTKVKGYYTKGVPVPLAITCGDYTDRFACAKQKGIVNRGIHIGFIKGDLCYQNASANELSKGGFLIKGGGTASGRAALYDDTDGNGTPDVTTLVPVSPQLQWVGNLGIQKYTMQTFDVECDGFDLEIINSSNNPLAADSVCGVFVLNGMGHFNIGAINLRGDCHRGIEVEHFNGDFVVESYTGVGTLSHEFSKGGRYLNINNDRGTAAEINFTSGGTHVAAVGETITGLTSSATGTVRLVRVTSGSFAAGTAAGYMHVDIDSGTFAAENATLTGGGNDMTVAAVSVGIYKPGYGTSANETQNACAQIVGKTFSAGTLASNVAAGATKIPLTAAVPTQIYEGDLIQVGTVWTVATECIVEPQFLDVASGSGVTTNVSFGGVNYVSVAPLVAAVTAPATVTVDQRAYVQEFKGGFRNSQYGLSVNNAYVKNCDLSEVGPTGQYALKMINDAHVEMVGRMPLSVGRAGLTDATVRVESTGSLLVCQDMTIRNNPFTSAHIQLPTAAGRAVFTGCRIETIASLHPTTEGNAAWDRVRHVGNFDFSGNPIRNGPYTVTPTVRTGGSATGIPISVNASRITEDSSSGVDLTIEVTLGTVAAPTAGTLDIVNSTSDTADWPAPNNAQTGIVDVIANGLLIPASVYCEIGTDKTITLYSQGATGRTALTNANIATGMQFRARLRYTRAAS